ncbi:MAG: rRNA pseudouridine synthase [Candidatus Omnitrophica bacterium]|jgi:23S rRNA pseudouridine2605 synthase|nr:rRNA pseudouridine synthase [Candidatus Omnitrophota bacterium]
MRLNVYISKSGYCSRRKADLLIKESKVTVNGAIIDKPFYEVDKNSNVCVGGNNISIKDYVYIVFNKPKGVTTTCHDKFADKKIVDFFPEKFRGIFPVGRLDKDTSGLIILTNDGKLCYQVTHPKFQIEKEYKIILDKVLSKNDIQKAIKGISDTGELLKVKKINLFKESPFQSSYGVVISEGKKRHLRRLFNALGYYVIDLKRIRIGDLSIGNLKSGDYIFLEKEKIYHLLFANPKLK